MAQIDELMSPAVAAKLLGMSQKTLQAHTKAGDISYIDIGRGLKRKRVKYDVSDLEKFKESHRHTDKDQGKCHSLNATRSSTTISRSTVYDFEARLARRQNERPNRSKPKSGKKPAGK